MYGCGEPTDFGGPGITVPFEPGRAVMQRIKTGTCTRAYRKGGVAQQLGARGKTFSVEQCSAGSRGMRTLRGMADRRRRLG